MSEQETPPATTTFGRLKVSARERKRRIRGVFTDIARRYDLMNDLMSLGIHRSWKRTVARHCRDFPGVAVDLAGGTGDIASLLRASGREVIVCDPSLAMMAIGRERRKGILWSAAEAEHLPFADCSIDLLTISFGLRNVTDMDQALREIHRVLKPGGHFVCLEFSHPRFWLAPFYNLYSRFVIPTLGAAVAGQPEAYDYLIESIRRFPDQKTLAGALSAAGFEAVHWRDLSFGIACIHFGKRP